MIALDSIEIVDKDIIQVRWFDNGNHCQTWDSNDIFNHIIEQQEEIERLNNIIDQTQKILYIKLMNENKEKIYIQEIIDIIENLKGSYKE